MPGIYSRRGSRRGRRNRVRPRGLSSSAIFSFRSFDFKSNKFIKRSTIESFIVLVICVSLV